MRFKCNILLLPLILVVALIFTKCTTKEQDVEYKLQKLVYTINKQCPIFTDSILQLDSCRVKGSEMTYLYTIIDEDAFDAELFEELGVPTIKDRLKNNPELDYFRKYNATLHYEYRNVTNKLIYKFTVANTEY